jgi:hypothetical protein
VRAEQSYYNSQDYYIPDTAGANSYAEAIAMTWLDTSTVSSESARFFEFISGSSNHARTLPERINTALDACVSLLKSGAQPDGSAATPLTRAAHAGNCGRPAGENAGLTDQS